ncbi:hypothetical protein J6590_106654, partial [Homalodisca vitripennis]
LKLWLTEAFNTEVWDDCDRMRSEYSWVERCIRMLHTYTDECSSAVLHGAKLND